VAMMGYPASFRLNDRPLALMPEYRMMPDLGGKETADERELSWVFFGGQLVVVVLVRCDHVVFVKAQPYFSGGPHEKSLCSVPEMLASGFSI
jgi:hypothetical protein